MAARKKGRRRPAARRSKRRARRAVVFSNPRRRTRRSYRRNPGGGFSVNGIVNQVKDTAIGAVAVVGGEATTRLVRSRLLGMTAGTTLSSVAELGIATGIGMLGQKFLGRQIARDMAVGGMAGVLRATAKQLGIPMVAEALSDDGGMNRYIMRNGRVSQINGYAARSRLNGYVNTGRGANAGGVLNGETDDELGY